MGSLPTPLALAPVALALLAGSWRTECDIEGMDVQVVMHGIGEPTDPHSSICRVAWLNHADLQRVSAGDLQGQIDYLFTDSRSYVPFRGRHGSVLYMENISQFQVPQDLDLVMQEKTQLLSVLMPPRDRWDELAEEIYRQAMAAIPEHVFIEDGSPETEAAAFQPYRFCILPEEDSTRHAVSPLFVRSLAYHTIAVFNGFVEVGAMVFNAIADYEPEPFDLMETLENLNRINKQLGALWHYQRIIQDQVQYRYNRPFEEKLYSQACTYIPLGKCFFVYIKPKRILNIFFLKVLRGVKAQCAGFWSTCQTPSFHWSSLASTLPGKISRSVRLSGIPGADSCGSTLVSATASSSAKAARAPP